MGRRIQRSWKKIVQGLLTCFISRQADPISEVHEGKQINACTPPRTSDRPTRTTHASLGFGFSRGVNQVIVFIDVHRPSYGAKRLRLAPLNGGILVFS